MKKTKMKKRGEIEEALNGLLNMLDYCKDNNLHHAKNLIEAKIEAISWVLGDPNISLPLYYRYNDGEY